MCQYSAQHGLANSWHAQHYTNLALSGASLVIFEAAAVSPIGRISDHDLGLWDDQQAVELKKIVSDIRSYSSAKLGIQIAHAGRKASTEVPWLGGHGIDEQQPRGWKTVAPSAIAFDDYPEPEALTQENIQQIKQQFIDAALEQKPQDSRLLSCMQRMAIYCTNFYLHYRINAKTNMAATLITDYAC